LLNPELLSQLHKFVPPWDWFASPASFNDKLCPEDFYNVLQWLKVISKADDLQLLLTIFQSLPNPPSELIKRWQGYLIKSRHIHVGHIDETSKPGYKQDRSDHELEYNWQEQPKVKNDIFIIFICI
jgi:hypothetical protein